MLFRSDIIVPEPVKIDYGEASNWFLDVELEASYSDVFAYVSIVLQALELAWACWRLWTSF